MKAIMLIYINYITIYRNELNEKLSNILGLAVVPYGRPIQSRLRVPIHIIIVLVLVKTNANSYLNPEEYHRNEYTD